MSRDITKTSKFLSLVLRHNPGAIGLPLDNAGWAQVDELIVLACKAGHHLDRALLELVVETNDKRRFAFSADRARIRANQGHSVAVDLELAAQRPSPILFHGTATRFLPSIRERGLIPGSRTHVHLSIDRVTAQSVGARHGKPVVLLIDAEAMHFAGLEFFLALNGVWLTKTVPVEFIRFDDAIDVG